MGVVRQSLANSSLFGCLLVGPADSGTTTVASMALQHFAPDVRILSTNGHFRVAVGICGLTRPAVSR